MAEVQVGELGDKMVTKPIASARQALMPFSVTVPSSIASRSQTRSPRTVHHTRQRTNDANKVGPSPSHLLSCRSSERHSSLHIIRRKLYVCAPKRPYTHTRPTVSVTCTCDNPHVPRSWRLQSGAGILSKTTRTRKLLIFKRRALRFVSKTQ